ncbi:MAG: hypothetical protein AAF498_09470 [Pseudomonadota bacterium]
MEGIALPQSTQSSAFAKWRTDIEENGFDTTSEEWRLFFDECQSVKFDYRETVLDALSSSRHILFVASGICAAQHELPDGDTRIARFFCETDFCTLVDFLSDSKDFNKFNNILLAMTVVEGIVIPIDLWMTEFVNGKEIGKYARLKMMKMHLFDIELLKVKTMNRTQNSFAFLEEQQSQVLANVPHKFIAQFLGITAEGFSRFLKSGRV